MSKLGRKQVEVSELTEHVGFWLRFVSNHVSQAFARKLLASGVTVAEWVMLREMYSESTLTPSALAGKTGLTRGAVSKLVDRLLHKRLLTREERSDDRRFQTIALTDEGRKMVPKLAALADENDAEFFSAITKSEREALLATLKKLVAANGLTRVPTE
ncbi:MAG TPA: MarR family transcriptional regulator [Acidobacteriaceae bacterium]|jgi:DNA-binding MarR family transcriptional regulator|nr:MarR family transcriptional regulator [Acidobacteriaceae bacterium]